MLVRERDSPGPAAGLHRGRWCGRSQELTTLVLGRPTARERVQRTQFTELDRALPCRRPRSRDHDGPRPSTREGLRVRLQERRRLQVPAGLGLNRESRSLAAGGDDRVSAKRSSWGTSSRAERGTGHLPGWRSAWSSPGSNPVSASGGGMVGTSLADELRDHRNLLPEGTDGLHSIGLSPSSARAGDDIVVTGHGSARPDRDMGDTPGRMPACHAGLTGRPQASRSRSAALHRSARSSALPAATSRSCQPSTPRASRAARGVRARRRPPSATPCRDRRPAGRCRPRARPARPQARVRASPHEVEKEHRASASSRALALRRRRALAAPAARLVGRKPSLDRPSRRRRTPPSGSSSARRFTASGDAFGAWRSTRRSRISSSVAGQSRSASGTSSPFAADRTIGDADGRRGTPRTKGRTGRAAYRTTTRDRVAREEARRGPDDSRRAQVGKRGALSRDGCVASRTSVVAGCNVCMIRSASASSS